MVGVVLWMLSGILNVVKNKKLKNMSEYNSNYEIAQAIGEKMGAEPILLDSVYEIGLQIYNELGGEPTRFDSVYEILLGILPLAERGGSGTIEDMATLPVASEYKNKVVRLTTDNNLYQSYLKSSKTITTNRLPDEQQIDKAYLYDTDNDSALYYRGIWKFICTDGEILLSCWEGDFENDYVYFTYDNAENINHNSETVFYGDTMYESVDKNAKTIIDNETLEDLKSHFNVRAFLNPIPATYNAPESAQIGNASFTDGTLGLDAIYSGEEVEHNNEVWYKWTTNTEGRYYISNKKASEIYGNFESYWLSDTKLLGFNGNNYVNLAAQDIMYIHIPQLNAPDSEQVGKATIKYNMGTNIFTATYDGTLTTLYDSIKDVSFTGYKWTTNSDVFITIVKAEELYSNAGTFSFMRQDGSEVVDAKEGVTEVNTVKYQRTKTTEIWDWKALTNDWAVGATYRYYNQGVAGVSYDNQDWFTAILKYTMKNYTKECLQELITKGYGTTTHLMVHLKYWNTNASKWYDDLIDITVSNAVESNLISLETFNTYVNEILNVKANEYDAHNYIYITNIGIYILSGNWNIDNMSFAMDEFSDAIAFPINTDIYPDYIETYPQKNE